uniref:Uncharacterized protein n=1 Tax=Ascaris lumbricoides TaxID=6252 RepID=A0A0M3IED8_ASCLU
MDGCNCGVIVYFTAMRIMHRHPTVDCEFNACKFRRQMYDCVKSRAPCVGASSPEAICAKAPVRAVLRNALQKNRPMTERRNVLWSKARPEVD